MLQEKRTSKRRDILDYLNCVEDDVGTILKNRQFCAWIHPEERGIHVLASYRIDMV